MANLAFRVKVLGLTKYHARSTNLDIAIGFFCIKAWVWLENTMNALTSLKLLLGGGTSHYLPRRTPWKRGQGTDQLKPFIQAIKSALKITTPTWGNEPKL